MKQNKTQRTDNSVSLFLDQIEPEQKRKDSHALVALMSQITAKKPKLWGTSIIGFGDLHHLLENFFLFASRRSGFVETFPTLCFIRASHWMYPS